MMGFFIVAEFFSQRVSFNTSKLPAVTLIQNSLTADLNMRCGRFKSPSRLCGNHMVLHFKFKFKN